MYVVWALAVITLTAICFRKKAPPPPPQEGATTDGSTEELPAAESCKPPAKSPARGGKSPARGSKSPARKSPAKSSSRGQYVEIDGERYDRSLVDLASELLDGKSSGKLGKAEAAKLWRDAKDGAGVTETERKTLSYIMNTFELTPDAKAFLKEQIEVAPSGSGYYAALGGRTRNQADVVVDREMWDAIQLMAKDGKIDLTEARKIWADALDGPGVTPTEKRTLEKALKDFEFTKGARDFLTKKVDGV